MYVVGIHAMWCVCMHVVYRCDVGVGIVHIVVGVDQGVLTSMC